MGKRKLRKEIDLRSRALRYIREHNTMSIATSFNDDPWAACVFYANIDFDLYFISNPNICLHCKNISLNPRVSVTISEDYRLRGFDDWRKIKGIQLEGEARMVEDFLELKAAVKAYIKKYPFTSIYLKQIFLKETPNFIERLLMKLGIIPNFSPSTENRFYVVKPKKVFLVDNSLSFERRIEVPI